MKQLTKVALAAYIREQLCLLPFDPNEDARQVLGCSLGAHRGYGRFRALLDLAKEFGIDLDKEAPVPRKKRAKAKPGTLASNLKTLRGFGQTEGYMRVIREGREK